MYKLSKHGLVVHLVFRNLACMLVKLLPTLWRHPGPFYPVAGYVKYMQNVNAVL